MDDFLQLRPDVFESVCVFFGLVHEFLTWKLSLSQAELMKLKSEFPPCFPKSYLGKKNISGRNSHYLNGRSFGTSNLNHRTTHGGFVVGQLYPPKPWRPWPPLSTEPQLRLNPRAPPADTPAAAPEGESKWRKLRPSVKSGGFVGHMKRESESFSLINCAFVELVSKSIDVLKFNVFLFPF